LIRVNIAVLLQAVLKFLEHRKECEETKMKIALGQMNAVIGDFTGNREKIVDFACKAKEGGADMLVTPELSLCGYPPMDLLDYPGFTRENSRSLRLLQHALPGGIAVAVGYVAVNNGSGKNLHNCVSVIRNGEILFSQAKSLLPTYDVFDEARYFEPAAQRRMFTFMGKKIGFAVCEDIWWETEHVAGMKYPVDPVSELLDAGADMIISPSASPYFAGKLNIRCTLLSRIGRNGGVPVVYVNMVGGNDNLIFDGASMLVSAKGELLHSSPAWEESLEIIDPDDDTGPLLDLPEEGMEAVRKALVLGLRDYVEKCGFRQVHLGLSGGVDSALVAALAVEAFGSERVKGFAMPSRYSSEGSRTDAEALASSLGIELDTIPIEPLFSAALSSMEPFFGGREADVAEENIQARIRGMLMMAYSNKWGSLLLTTGNKSELATGYCTLYGDMCGGISVIGDLFKVEVFALCRHINEVSLRSGGTEIIPDSIITKPPSAELRDNQKDEDSLPPYDVLDAILHRYLLRNESADEIIAAGFDEALVRRILTLVGRNEYKRRQAPPVLKVSARAFGTGRRMPLARKIHEA
jgi:NAD+ synthase (glutamine-hydrolysing)